LDHHKNIELILASGNSKAIERLFREPGESDMFYGFDRLSKSLRVMGERIENKYAPKLTLDAIVTIAEAIDAKLLSDPVEYRIGRSDAVDVTTILSKIDAKIGFKLSFPNPYPSEYGLVTERGIASYRAPQAMFQAWRINQLLAGVDKPRVLEIGGGLGRTAYYARQFGILDYTIVDIPISSLAQGYFIGRTCGEGAVSLYGESSQPNNVKLMSPKAFFQDQKRYDLIANFDSLTEIGRTAAEEYWRAIEMRAACFLSVNHERNEFTVSDLIGSRQKSRTPYWLRRGYVEEIVVF